MGRYFVIMGRYFFAMGRYISGARMPFQGERIA
jgi:hypothetical protein